MKRFSAGFTLIELLIVIAIIGILSTLAIVSFSAVRTKTLDVRRVVDINIISLALEMYFSDSETYPLTIAPGQPISFNNKTYIAAVPANPNPRSNLSCADNEYTYVYVTATNRFAIGYCLGYSVGDLSPGLHIARTGMISQEGLIAWWKFDESSGLQAIDSAGNYGGTINGAARQSLCRLGPCLNFDAYDDYVALSAATPAGTKTISGWVYPNTVTNNHQAIFGNRIAQINSNGKLAYHDASLGYLFSDGVLSANQWTYVTFVYDGSSNKVQFYINGEPSGEETTTGFATTTSTIGELAPGSGDNAFPFDGRIDDLRLYNRVLGYEEIKALYESSNN